MMCVDVLVIVCRRSANKKINSIQNRELNKALNLVMKRWMLDVTGTGTQSRKLEGYRSLPALSNCATWTGKLTRISPSLSLPMIHMYVASVAVLV